MDRQTLELADALAGGAVRSVDADPGARGADWRTATVTAVGAAGTVDCGTIRARRLESYQHPTVGDTIILTHSGAGAWLAVGRTASAADALGIARIVHKTTATDRTSTATLTADPDLTVELGAAAVYLVEMHLLMGGPSGGLPTTAWSVPSGASGLKAVHGAGSTAVDGLGDNIVMRAGGHGFGTAVTYGRRTVTTSLLYAIETGVVTTTSAGTLALTWAQSASTATATRMGVGSWMRVTRYQ
ncbi:hypothetical protein H3146_07240 [Streptomyces sp. OF3]|uniref:Uncharacterized protein n=1 Tax=Streptomyces alkaliterrae TaxID=2213162 RepID=A0A7W3ZLS8_9ACTN|nr:hypothetical protein [Streptomyces alkaliterrae]MBB1253164.1 hypothetical protein [Streptomyces alkaliterrae]